MNVKCHFCMEQDPVKRIAGPVGKKGPVVFELCQECADEKEVCAKRVDNLLKLQHKNPSDLCVGCGICCMILHARITQEEVDAMIKEHGVKLEDIALDTEVSKVLYPGDMVMKFPCIFLMGRPLGKWTACRIHSKIRPDVCRSYLCKMAIRYKIGTISLNEARYWLRTAILDNDLSIFNWIRDDQDVKILMASQIEGRISDLRKQGLSEDQIQFNLASVITPKYKIKSALDELTLDMHFATADRDDFDLKVFFTTEEIEDHKLSSLSPIEVTRMTIERVVKTFRNYFDREERDLFKPVAAKVDEKKIEELREEIKG